MATVLPSHPMTTDPAEAARLQFVLRFAFGTTASFAICEWMGWQPSALAPVLTGVLLANLPASPPPKVGIVLVVLMAVSAWLAFFLTTWLSQTPHILFPAIGFIMFLAFVGLARGKGQLPLTLLLICMAVVPVVTLTVSQYAGLLPAMLVRGMALAVPVVVVAQIALMQDYDRYRDLAWEGSFEEYLSIVRERPHVTRNAFQRVYDMVISYGTEEYIDNKKKLVRFNFFRDETDGGKDAVFGLDIPLMRLMNVLKAAAEGYGPERRVILLHGPVGSSKSTIARLLLRFDERALDQPVEQVEDLAGLHAVARADGRRVAEHA